MNKIRLTRKELYDLVWSEPLITIARKYQTSDHILRAACKKYNIPLPKSGHWMKLQFGKSVIKEELKDNYEGLNEIFLNESPTEEINITGSPSPLFVLKSEIENDKKLSLKVPDSLVNPDKLIVSVKEALADRHGYSSHGNRLRAWDQLKIIVTKENIGRALRFMDTFIKVMNARGHDIEINNGDTNVVIFNEKMKISCREKAKRVTVQGTHYNSTELRSTGILTFNLEGFYAKEWKDGKLMLEEQLSAIIAKLEIEGKRLKEQTEERERYWAEEAKKKQILERRQKVKETELEKFKSLILAARKCKEVLILREYIAAVKEKAKVEGEIDDELKNWLEWAQNKIDWYDPLINHPDPELEGVDKDTLTFKGRSSG